MVRGKKKESSVVFIGDEDKEPLLLNQKESNNGGTSKKSNLRNHRKNLVESLNLSQPFPSTFIKYLFSEKSILTRLFSSLCPPFGQFKRIAVDYEGSLLSTFLLTVTIYWGLINANMKSDDEDEPINRLLAGLHASGLTVGYLLITSAFTWALSLCTKTTINPRQILCILGYGLFGHAIVLMICEIGSEEWFMSLMTVIGGLDSVRICLILLKRTPKPACRFVLCTPVAIIHLLYLVYLHFAIMKT